MFVIRTLVLFLLSLVFGQDFRTYDYCKLNCKEGKHSACECSLKPPREEVTTDPDTLEFRKVMVETHNYWRNFVASGLEERPKPGLVAKAANMLVINYDLEIEHIARCRARNSFRHTAQDKTGHDVCRKRIGNLSVGQNLQGHSVVARRAWDDFNKHWYGEVEWITDTTLTQWTPEPNTPGKLVGHFTQMIRWSVDMVGCWRVVNRENKPAWTHTLICNYGSSMKQPASNVRGVAVYAAGEPCSKCPEGTTCNDRYTALCGTLKPIPTEIHEIKDGAESLHPSLLVWVLGSVTCWGLVY